MRSIPFTIELAYYPSDRLGRREAHRARSSIPEGG